MFHCCFFFFILSPNWASREAAAAACKCPRGEHMFSDVWGFVSIWENDERELGANDPTYWLANAVLDTTLGNVTESICQFVSRGLQIATVWLSHFEWILYFFLRKTPAWWNVFKGLSRSFTTVTQFFGRFFTVSFSVNYQNAAFCFHCQNSKETEQRWEWKFRFQKNQDSCRQYIIVIRGAFILLLSRFSRGDDDNAGTTFGKLLCCLFYFHNPIILLREMVKVSALSGEPCTGGNCDLLRGWRTFIEWFHFQIQILFFIFWKVSNRT